MAQCMVMLQALLDIIFPPRKEELLVRTATTPQALRCLEPQIIDTEILALTPFSAPLLQALIHENKFHHNTKAARLLGTLLATHLEGYSPHTLLPIPLSKKRYRERGFNQVTSIIKKSGGVYREDILYRNRHTVPQTTLSRTGRLKNLTGAFSVNTSALQTIPSDHTLLIIDDVSTTGATCKAAKEALHRAAPERKVVCIALAH